MAKVRYDLVTIRVDDLAVAWVFVAPQDLTGGATVAANRFDRPGGAVHMDGDVSIGNPKDGTYDIEFNVTVSGGVPGPLQLGDREYDLRAGRCFVVQPGYRIAQLPAFSEADGRRLLSGAGR
jgi:hypothetical protein